MNTWFQQSDHSHTHTCASIVDIQHSAILPDQVHPLRSSTFDVALVNDTFEQALLIHAAPVDSMPKGVLCHDPVDMGWVLLPKPEDTSYCLHATSSNVR